MTESSRNANDPFALQPELDPQAELPRTSPETLDEPANQNQPSMAWVLLRELVETVVLSLVTFLLIRQVVPMFFDFHERIGRWPDAPRGRTRREIIALRKGLPVFRGHGTARTDVTEENAVRLAEELPPPTFDADRRLRQLDEEE